MDRIECDHCNKKAVANYQDVLMRFAIDSKGEYSKGVVALQFDGGVNTNTHLCEMHENKFLSEE